MRGSCLVASGLEAVDGLPAGKIEAAVIDQLRAVFRQPEIIAGTWKAARAQADDRTERLDIHLRVDGLSGLTAKIATAHKRSKKASNQSQGIRQDKWGCPCVFVDVDGMGDLVVYADPDVLVFTRCADTKHDKFRFEEGNVIP